MADHRSAIRLNFGGGPVDPDFLDRYDRVEIQGNGRRPKLYRYWERYDLVEAPKRRMLIVALCPNTDIKEPRRVITVERYMGRARVHGYDSVGVCNLFCRKASSPAEIRAASFTMTFDQLKGELADEFMLAAAMWANTVFFAWGSPPRDRRFSRVINARAVEVYALCVAVRKYPLTFGLTYDQWPLQAVFARFDRPLERWFPPNVEPRHPTTQRGPSIKDGLY